MSRSVSCFCRASTFPFSSIFMSLSDWSLCLRSCSEFCSLSCTNNQKEDDGSRKVQFNAQGVFFPSTPLLKLHDDLLHVVHPLLQLHSLRFLPLRLSFRVLWSYTGCWVAWSIWLGLRASWGLFTWAFWNICRLRVLTWSSWSLRAASVSCFSCASFSSSFMATSISCFRLTWSSNSRSRSWNY